MPPDWQPPGQVISELDTASNKLHLASALLETDTAQLQTDRLIVEINFY